MIGPKSFLWPRTLLDNPKEAIHTPVVLVSCLILGTLYGCSDRIEIDSFSVIGTSTPINGVVPINSGFNSGRFTVSWSVLVESGEGFNFESKSTGYSVVLHLSDDDELSTGTDVRFYSEECGKSASAENCNDDGNGSIRCNFTNENKIVCGVSNGQQETDITDWLGELPKRVSLFLEACHENGEPCDNRFARVELR